MRTQNLPPTDPRDDEPYDPDERDDIPDTPPTEPPPVPLREPRPDGEPPQPYVTDAARLLRLLLHTPFNGWSLRTRQVQCSVYQSNVRERLRKVAGLSSALRVITLGEKAYVITNREEPFEEAMPLVMAADPRELTSAAVSQSPIRA